MIPGPINPAREVALTVEINRIGGFPHSEIVGSKIAHISPTLIAACHVLHRLYMPRHPRIALTSRLRVHTTNDNTGSPNPIEVLLRWGPEGRRHETRQSSVAWLYRASPIACAMTDTVPVWMIIISARLLEYAPGQKPRPHP